MGCRRHNYWYSQGAFRCKKCGHVTYKSNGRKKDKTAIILIPIIIVVAIVGYFVYQTYGTPESIQSEANKIINNTGNTIQQISSQSQKSISNLQENVTSSTNEANPVPIAVYDNCQSTLRTDEKIISTMCTLPPPNYQKQFAFNMPDVLVQALQNQVPFFVKTTVYQYGTNNFEIGLFDQLGEKNYTVTLWQFPS